MKKLTAFLATAMLVTALTGCGSLFSTGDAPKQGGEKTESAEGSAASVTGTDIQISDTFTHQDPEDMEYAARYAYTCGKNAPDMVEGFKQEYDLDFVENIMIIYGDAEDKPLAQYEYYVMATEEDAKKCCDILGGDFTAEGNVAYSVSDAETTQMMIDMNVQYGSLQEKTVSAYALFMKDVNAYMDIE